MGKINVLIIEDDYRLAESVGEYLQLADISCDFAHNGASGLKLASEGSCSVIILDINLPKLDGLSLCSQLRKAGSDTPILMLTARDSLDDKLAGFRSGTDDYLVKPFAMAELLARIRALSGRRSNQQQVLRVADLEMDIDTHQLHRAGNSLTVTSTGWRILEHLMRVSPRAVSQQELESIIWGDDMPETNSFKVHLFKLRQEVDKPYAQKLIHTIPRHGYCVRGAT